MKQHLKITVEGRVQGVGFRYHTKQMARQLGLKGYVKNMSNGNVYIEVEGIPEIIKEFLLWCKSNPGFSAVENITTDKGDVKNYAFFEVKF